MEEAREKKREKYAELKKMEMVSMVLSCLGHRLGTDHIWSGRLG